MLLTLDTRHAPPDITVVDLRGYLTLGNELMDAEKSLAKLIEASPKKIVFDLRHLEVIDSAGVGMLLLCAGVSERTGGQIAICGPNDRVGHIFKITHLGRVIPIYPDLKAAVASF